MKKIIAVALILLISMLCGCASVSEVPQPTTGQTSAPTQEPATEPATEPTTVPTTLPATEPEPETVPGKVLYAPAPAVLAVLNRGDSVEILEDMGDICRVRFGEITGMMEKRLLRPDSAEDYVPWTAYAKYNAAMYDDYRLSGEGEQLPTNTKLEVIDDCGDFLVILVEEKIGYIRSSSVSKFPIRGGGGGGSSGGADGGDISLSAKFPGGRRFNTLSATSALPSLALRLLSSTEESTPVLYSGAAAVLADGAELVLVWLEPGDEVRVLSADSASCTVYYEGHTASLSRFLVLLEEDEPYTSWEGYAKVNAYCHSDYYLNDPEPERLVTNTVLTVIGELDHCYAVSLDGRCVFIDKNSVSENKVYTGGGGSGGNTGGGDWSPPAL